METREALIHEIEKIVQKDIENLVDNDAESIADDIVDFLFPKAIVNDFGYLNDMEFVKAIGSTIMFTIQDGAIKMHGKNGCQVDDVIIAARRIIEGFNKRFPCSENDDAIAALNLAVVDLENRKKNREKRGVEGLDKK